MQELELLNLPKFKVMFTDMGNMMNVADHSHADKNQGRRDSKTTPQAPKHVAITSFSQEEHAAVLKLNGGKADGGFSVEGETQVYVQLDWYKSSDIIFDEEDLSVSFLPMMQSFD